MTGGSFVHVEDGGHDGDRKFKGAARVLGPPWAHLPTITIGLLGVQIFWSVEMSYASPYLLSLGLSKSSMAVVFVAGPLSGLIMQPLIGVLADNSTSRFGRRRPYMLLGTVICISAMLLLGFTRAVASIFTGWDNDANDTLTIWLAVLAIYLIDFSINAVQAVDRALLVDTIPSSNQAAGNAWAARMLGVGSVVGFFVGNINLPKILPFLGKTQLQVLSVVVSILLLSGHLCMAVMVKERVLLKSNSSDGKGQRNSFLQEIKDIWVNARTLPRVIRQICIIQFFSSIGWFPMLFYSTIYVGDLFKRSQPIPSSDEDRLSLDAEATRLGSRALFYSAVLSLAMNLLLPAFVAESSSSNPSRRYEEGWKRLFRIPKRLKVHLASIWASSFLIFALCMFSTFFIDSVATSSLMITVTGFSWAVAQWAPFSLLSEAILTEPATQSSMEESTAIRLADTRSRSARPYTQTNEEHSREEREGFLSNHRPDDFDHDDYDDDDDDEAREERRREERRRVLSNSGAQMSRIDITQPGDDEDGYEIVGRDGENGDSGRGHGRSRSAEAESKTLSSKAGIILGIHNTFIVIPQFLVTGLAAIIFAIVDPQKPTLPSHRTPNAGPAPPVHKNGTILVGDGLINVTESVTEKAGELVSYVLSPRADGQAHSTNSVVYILRIGGVAAVFAFVLSWRLARELKHR